MTDGPCVLILGGTGEGAALARALVDVHPQITTLSSLAGRTRTPKALPGEIHVGGFGGAQGLADFMQRRAVAAVVDATHPYAAQISRHARLACEAPGIPRVQLLRPAWQPADGDCWIDARDAAAAAARLPELGCRVFLSTGRQDLAAFADLKDVWFLLRTVDPLQAPPPLACWQAVAARGPFCVDQERDLLLRNRIDLVISKNSGGEATYGKILAARALSLPVLMLQRPPPEPGPTLRDVESALLWVRSCLGT